MIILVIYQVFIVYPALVQIEYIFFFFKSKIEAFFKITIMKQKSSIDGCLGNFEIVLKTYKQL